MKSKWNTYTDDDVLTVRMIIWNEVCIGYIHMWVLQIIFHSNAIDECGWPTFSWFETFESPQYWGVGWTDNNTLLRQQNKIIADCFLVWGLILKKWWLYSAAIIYELFWSSFQSIEWNKFSLREDGIYTGEAVAETTG